MRISAFHAGDGDCLLLTSSTPEPDGSVAEHHLLVDGGRAETFREQARLTIYALDRLDVVCVSHIDEDHIAGIVALVEDMVAWRVHRFREQQGRRTTEPSFPEPPEIGGIWHNSLFDLVGTDLEPQVQPAMATMAGIFRGSSDPFASDLGSRLDDLATGERSAMELSRRISDRQLGIPRNRPADEPMLRRSRRSFLRVGPMTIRVLGPSEDDLERLRARWREWVDGAGDALAKLQKEMLDDEQRLGTLSGPQIVAPLAASLGEGAASVTAPNLASLMLLVQEKGGGRILLTGDGLSAEILEGLRHYAKLDDGAIHVEALKVQHHGALANMDAAFVDAVTADHYLFCGNGAHHNPEPEVVSALALARLTGREGAAPIGPRGPFTFSFTSSSRTRGLSDERQRHMADIEVLVQQIKSAHDPTDRFHFTFLDGGHLTIDC